MRNLVDSSRRMLLGQRALVIVAIGLGALLVLRDEVVELIRPASAAGRLAPERLRSADLVGICSETSTVGVGLRSADQLPLRGQVALVGGSALSACGGTSEEVGASAQLLATASTSEPANVRGQARTVAPATPTPDPALDTGSLMPVVNAARLAAGPAGFSVERANATNERPGPSDGTGAFRTVCDFSHMSFDDPIVYPGQPGRSHLHTFFGNTGANASSTASSIAKTGNSTCRGGILNRSAYWVPAMIDTRDGTPIRPRTANFYYKTGYRGVVPGTVQPMPEGLRIIAGDAKNAGPGGQYENMPFGYSCASESGSSMDGRSIPNCPAGSEVWQHIYFPQCWDGVNLDSPDHKSHMAYPTPGRGCPSSHPVPLPEITFNIVYPVTEANSASRWRLASDNYSASFPGGYSGHGDWFNGWNPKAMDAFVKGCDQPALDCHSHLLGDGRAIY